MSLPVELIESPPSASFSGIPGAAHWRDKASADLSWLEVLGRIAEHARSEVVVTRLLETLPFQDIGEAARMHCRVARVGGAPDDGAPGDVAGFPSGVVAAGLAAGVDVGDDAGDSGVGSRR